jgi:Ni,Fe-hydrogenase III large subunit/Ni,Fe-hydrogenase III component G
MNGLAKIISSGFGAAATTVEGRHPLPVDTLLVPAERFREAAGLLRKNYALLAAEWCSDETPFGRGFGIYACYRRGMDYLIVKTDAPFDEPSFPSLTKEFVPAYRFERQMMGLMGVLPEGLPDRRPWIRFEDWPEDAWPLRKSFDGSKPLPRIEGDYAWIKAEGEGVYEIPVGPVHAGIIEPGHFRFQAVGETVLNLEERLGYVHKGIEKRFETMPWGEGYRLAGRVSGDTTVAHSLAYCRALEAMTGCEPTERAHWLRALFLERERIANHLGDIGAICNDAAFAMLLYQLSTLKEKLVRTNSRLFGHRFLMDRIIPGGVTVDINDRGRREILDEMNTLSKDFERLVVIYDENASLEDRVKDTGILIPSDARELCTVGIVSRASGMNLDCRTQSPFPPYDSIAVNVPVYVTGDVDARVRVRIDEIRESIRIIREIAGNLPSGELVKTCAAPGPEGVGFAAVEGWRGEILYWLQSGPEGEVNRVMVRDPSSVNWLGLEQAIHGNIVPDFPLCNKSFNQSYSGHDL